MGNRRRYPCHLRQRDSRRSVGGVTRFEDDDDARDELAVCEATLDQVKARARDVAKPEPIPSDVRRELAGLERRLRRARALLR